MIKIAEKTIQEKIRKLNAMALFYVPDIDLTPLELKGEHKTEMTLQQCFSNVSQFNFHEINRIFFLLLRQEQIDYVSIIEQLNEIFYKVVEINYEDINELVTLLEIKYKKVDETVKKATTFLLFSMLRCVDSEFSRKLLYEIEKNKISLLGDITLAIKLLYESNLINMIGHGVNDYIYKIAAKGDKDLLSKVCDKFIERIHFVLGNGSDISLENIRFNIFTDLEGKNINRVRQTPAYDCVYELYKENQL